MQGQSEEPHGDTLEGGGKKPSEDELKSYVKSNLARFKVPREFEIVDDLPRNATGKVVKRELEEQEKEKQESAA